MQKGTYWFSDYEQSLHRLLPTEFLMVMKQEVLVGLKPTNKGKTVRIGAAVPSDNQLILRTNSSICPCL